MEHTFIKAAAFSGLLLQLCIKPKSKWSKVAIECNCISAPIISDMLNHALSVSINLPSEESHNENSIKNVAKSFALSLLNLLMACFISNCNAYKSFEFLSSIERASFSFLKVGTLIHHNSAFEREGKANILKKMR